jgi:hypothetical protein
MNTPSKPVAILGCGPAGLFAAQAIKTAGGQPVIISNKMKSKIYGAQYLQRPIPGLCSPYPDGLIYTYLLGTKEQYAERVYGDPNIATSWPDFQPEPQPAWDLRIAYDRAWEEFHEQVIDTEIHPEDVADLTANFSVVISTIPAGTICERPDEHDFEFMDIRVAKFSVMQSKADNYVVYNGTSSGGWYRCAKIFGHASTEAAQNVPKSWESGYKILGNNCDCHPNLIKTGRLGAWKRGVLTHHAFEDATNAYMERLSV